MIACLSASDTNFEETLSTLKVGITNNGLTKKYRIRETPTLSTDADRRTDTNLKRLSDLSKKKIKIKN